MDAGGWDQELLQLRALGHQDDELLRLAGLRSPERATRRGPRSSRLVDAGGWDQELLQLRALGHQDDELLRLAGP